MRTEHVNGHEVSSDGNVVWVNDAVRCVARLGAGGMEFVKDGDVSAVKVTKVSTAWRDFKSGVERMTGVVVSDVHQPSWARPE